MLPAFVRPFPGTAGHRFVCPTRIPQRMGCGPSGGLPPRCGWAKILAGKPVQRTAGHDVISSPILSVFPTIGSLGCRFTTAKSVYERCSVYDAFHDMGFAGTMPYHLDDRTFEGYRLYSAEVQRRIEAAEKRADTAEKTAKRYKERQSIFVSMFVAGILLMTLSVYVQIGRDILRIDDILWCVHRIHWGN